jgi:hypothetical protein
VVMTKYTFKGRGLVQLTGRGPYNGVMPPSKAVIIGNFEVIDKAIVDGECWRTVQVIPRVSKWIKTQNTNLWYEHKTANHYKVLDTFDISEKFYTMLVLRWSETA